MSPVCANICFQERASLSRGMIDNNSEHPALAHSIPLHSGLGETKLPWNTGMGSGGRSCWSAHIQ